MSTLKYWLWLGAIRSISPQRANLLLDRFGTPEKIHAATRKEYEELGILTQDSLAELCKKSFLFAEQILEACEQKQIQIITIQDAKYPVRLKQIYDPPLILYVRGTLPDIDDEAGIAVVGTRNCTVYGLRATQRVCSEIARGGGLIISGMAKGIDSASHQAALYVGAKTVAVLGCGADVCYPRENFNLMQAIIKSGAVVSEYPPGTQPVGAHFPVRNRIISGLSLGVLIAEAPARSGALITASLAAEQSRDVFAIPGNIDSKFSMGTNQLIRDGAKLVLGGRDVLCEYEAMFPHKITPDKTYYKEKTENTYQDEKLKELLSKFGPDERSVLNAIGNERVHVDMIIEKSGLEAPHVLSLLTVLEISGVVKQMPGKLFVLEKQ